VLDYPDRSVADMPGGASGAHHEGLNLIPSLGEKLFLGGPTVPPVRRDTPADDLLDEAEAGGGPAHHERLAKRLAAAPVFKTWLGQ
jgi:hypothetical protein